MYALVGVASPAPPWPALCGLLGILAGEWLTGAVRGAVRERAAGQRISRRSE
ncbi:DUF1427 family protein [Streptomyces sp. NPDC058867]|uniref:DUF1427 family protein n=1 Tax=Streptomyces sp. NPDC058867 TaxID=3346657 RepID=UPI003694B1E6